MSQETTMKAEIAAKPDFSRTIREDGTIMDVRGFVKQLAQSRLYWIVAAFGVEWNYVLCRVADEFIGRERPDPDPLVFLHGLPRDYPEYGRFYMPVPPDIHFYRRDKVPAEVLAVRLGLSTEEVRKADAVVMKQTKEMLDPALPKPTIGLGEYSTALH